MTEISPTPSLQDLKNLLQQIWGYSSFRFPQAEVIQCLLESQDAVVVMPTGGGKSICFQLPAVLQEGLTIVVSPLIALMENQVQELRDRRLSAACLHNELSRYHRRQVLQSLEQGQLSLLYVAPETLLSPNVWTILCQPQIKIRGLMLDEAHCLVQWGDSFRPVYRRLGSFRQALLRQNPQAKPFGIAAFTATATPETQQDIATSLQLKNPRIFALSPYRSHLRLMVKIAWSNRCRRDLMLNFINLHPGQSGLIYVRSRRDSELLSQALGLLKYKTIAYHGGLGSQQRREIEQQWLRGELPFVVCTNAFGLGINKPDIRWILHYHPPALLSEYLQEIGRGGRDQLPANCLTLMSEPTGWLDPSDRQRQSFFQQQLEQQYRQATAIARQIPRQGEIQAIKATFPDLELSLSLLHRLGQLSWVDPFHYRLLNDRQSPHFSPIKALAAQSVQPYLITRQCRWQFLLQAFGWLSEAKNLACGQCDNCRRFKFKL